jgi:hypothetical protein
MGNQTLLSWLASILHKIIEATVGRFGRGTKAQATLFYGGSSLICQSLRFVGIVISTRLTAADQFGLLATSMAMIGFSGLIKEIGQNSAYMSCRAEERGFTSFHFAWSVLGGFAAAAFLLILVDSVPGLIGLRPVLPWLLLIVILEATAQTPLIISQKRFEFDRVAIVEISSVAVWMITVTIGAFLLRNLSGRTDPCPDFACEGSVPYSSHRIFRSTGGPIPLVPSLESLQGYSTITSIVTQRTRQKQKKASN